MKKLLIFVLSAAIITAAVLVFMGVLVPKTVIERFIETDCSWQNSDYNIEIFNGNQLKDTFESENEYNAFVSTNQAMLDHIKLGKCRLDGVDIPVALVFGTSGNSNSANIYLAKYSIENGKLIVSESSADKIIGGNAQYSLTGSNFIIKDVFVFNNFGDDKLTTAKEIVLIKK